MKSVLLCIISLLLSFDLIFASPLSFPVISTKCTRTLEETIFNPESCAFLYMQSIAYKFLARSQIVFGPVENVDAFIYAFENEFEINVDLADAFGQVVNYYPDGTKSFGYPSKYSNSARAYLNFPGFARQPSDSTFYYTFQIYSRDGEYYAVILSMPMANDPIVCWCCFRINK